MFLLFYFFVLLFFLGLVATVYEFYIQIILPASHPLRIARNQKLRKLRKS